MAPRQKNVWVTGAAGFSGKHLVQFLRTLPEPLRLIGMGVRPNAPEGLDVYEQVDLADETKLRALASALPPSHVIHLAGLLPPAPETDLWRVNVGGTLNLLNALADRGPAVRFLTVGSAAEYSDFSARRVREDHQAGGNTSYGRTKWAQSTLALAFGAQRGMKIMVARTFNLIGPGAPQTLVSGSLCAQFANGHQAIKVGNLTPRRDFIDIRDAVAAYWAICQKGTPGTIYNVCNGKTRSIRELVELFRQYAPAPHRIQRETSHSRKDDLNRVCGDNSKLLKLGYRARISLKQSVCDMLASARTQ